MAIEAVKGTAIANPTNYVYLNGMITPEITLRDRTASNGTLSNVIASEQVRLTSAISGEGNVDMRSIAHLFAMLVDADPVITEPVAATSYQRLYTPSSTADNLDSGTFWWGDPGTQVFQSSYVMLTELGIESNASGTDGTTMSFSAFGKAPIKIADPTLPSVGVGQTLIPGNLQVKVNTSANYAGTTLTSRVVSVAHTLRTGAVPKWLGAGPTGGLSFTRHGRAAPRGSTTVVLEMVDTVEYDLIMSGVPIYLRCMHHGALISGASYNAIYVDMKGVPSGFSWGELEGANRTLEFTIDSVYDASIAADYRVYHISPYATLV